MKVEMRFNVNRESERENIVVECYFPCAGSMRGRYLTLFTITTFIATLLKLRSSQLNKLSINGNFLPFIYHYPMSVQRDMVAGRYGHRSMKLREHLPYFVCIRGTRWHQLNSLEKQFHALCYLVGQKRIVSFCCHLIDWTFAP